MHIAVVTGRFPTVSETFVLDQVTGLIDDGHQVTVIAGPPKSKGQVHRDVEAYGLRKRVLYWSGLPGWKQTRKVGRQFDGARLVDALRELPKMAKSYPRAAPRLLERAVRLCGSPEFDAVLCHFGHLGLECEMLRRLGVLRGPLATIFHGYDMSVVPRQRGDDVYELLFEGGDLFVPISKFWRRRLIQMGAPRENTVVHRMGVDPSRFRFRERRPENGEVRILTVGRLVEKKGIRYGLEAFSQVADDYCSARFTVVGDGPLRSELEELSHSLGVADRVDFTGLRSRKEVLEAFEEHHLLMAPSVTGSDGDMEGIPVVLMEAMATGMPVVSTRHSGIPELVAHGESGLLVAERDVAGLGRALRQLLKKPQRWVGFGRRGREIIENRFSAKRLNKRLVGLLERIA